jgi:hypothetical protein
MGTGLGLGIGIPFLRMGAGIDPQAQAHYDRVIADGGLIPSGLVGVNNFFKTVKAIYGTSDITTAISVGLDAQVLGYKLGAGAGTTAGQAAQKLYSCSGSSGDVEQTTAASQPLLLVHSGANYWFGSGINGNHLTTPTSAANSNSGNKEIIARVDFRAGLNTIASKNNQAYCLFLNSSGFFSFNCTTDLTSLNNNFSTAAISPNFSGWVKCTAEFAGGSLTIKFFTSSDNITYTQIGSNVVIAGNNFINTSGTLYIGSVNGGSDFLGAIYRLTISNSIGGTPVVDFNPSQYNAATSQTQWTSSTGEVWTINTGTAATGYKGVLVDRTEVQGDGINDRLLSGTLTSRSTFSRFCATNPLNINIFKGIVGANAADRHYLYATSTDVAIYNGVALNFSGEQANRLALYEGDYNGASGSTLLNNTTSSSGNVGSGSSTVVELFALVDGSFGNVVINTLIDLSAIATTQQKTDTYNYIRSINNNAF